MSRDILDLPTDQAAHKLARGYLDAAAAARARIMRGEDPRALHDLRVALRRLRGSLRAYAPYVASVIPAKLSKRLRALARLTNAARDAEVQLEWLDSSGRKARAAERPGRRWMREYLVSQRKMAYRTVRREALPEFDRIARRLRRTLEAKPVVPSRKPPVSRARFAQAAARQLREYAAILSADLGDIGSVEDEAEVHAARIAAKHLRYLVEPLARGKRATALLKSLKALQESLGGLHDRHVLARDLARALRSGVPHDTRCELLPGLSMLALRNHQEANGLYEDIARSYLGGRTPALLRPLRDFARQLAARGVHPASRA